MEQQSPHGVLVCDHAGLVISQVTRSLKLRGALLALVLVSWMAQVGSLHVPVLGEQIILRSWGGDASQSTFQGSCQPYEFSIRCFARCEPAACWQLWCSPGTPQPKRRVLARAISRGLSHNSQSPLIASEWYLNDTRGSYRCSRCTYPALDS